MFLLLFQNSNFVDFSKMVTDMVTKNYLKEIKILSNLLINYTENHYKIM